MAKSLRPEDKNKKKTLSTLAVADFFYNQCDRMSRTGHACH